MFKVLVMVVSGKFVIILMEGRIWLVGVVEFGGFEVEFFKVLIEFLKKNICVVMLGLIWKCEVEWMGYCLVLVDFILVIGVVLGVKGVWLGFGYYYIGLMGGLKIG